LCVINHTQVLSKFSSGTGDMQRQQRASGQARLEEGWVSLLKLFLNALKKDKAQTTQALA